LGLYQDGCIHVWLREDYTLGLGRWWRWDILTNYSTFGKAQISIILFFIEKPSRLERATLIDVEKAGTTFEGAIAPFSFK
jgi:hypothetical protein